VGKQRKSGLTTLDLYLLERACQPVWEGFDGHTYLVGTAQNGGPYRDVDVRTILPDDEFDAIFGSRPALWELVCFAVASLLAQQTGLPIDYQVQRRSEANEKYRQQDGHQRNPVGIGVREYAGLGDATGFKHAAAAAPVPAPATEEEQ
jgi:hypothetical protein